MTDFKFNVHQNGRLVACIVARSEDFESAYEAVCYVYCNMVGPDEFDECEITHASEGDTATKLWQFWLSKIDQMDAEDGLNQIRQKLQVMKDKVKNAKWN